MRDDNYPNIAGCKADRRPEGPSGGRPKPGPGWRRGLTLIELMIAMLIMLFVTAAAFTLFRITATYESHQQELMTQTQNLRAALYAVTRDIRMAGSGMPMIGSSLVYIYVDPGLLDKDVQNQSVGNGWFTYAGETETGVRAIFGKNSGTDENKSDSLTIFRSELESTFSLGRLKTGFTPGSSGTITLQEGVAVGSTFTSGDILAISDGMKTVIVQGITSSSGTEDSLSIGPRFEPEANIPGGHTFESGSQVFNLRDVTFVTYYVDTENNRLMADYHDVTLKDEDADDSNKKHLVTVADNIEDFQVAYYLRRLSSEDLIQTADISMNNFNDGDVVSAVQVALVSRSQKMSNVYQAGEPITVMGHKAKGEDKYDDRYTRRAMSEIIQLRNF